MPVPFARESCNGWGFMKIEKPYNWCDTYYCYKKHMAIILSVRVNARGRFKYVSAGGAGR
jgi:hypothetical protein